MVRSSSSLPARSGSCNCPSRHRDPPEASCTSKIYAHRCRLWINLFVNNSNSTPQPVLGLSIHDPAKLLVHPSQGGGKGRDHNPYVFTNWLCGGGIKGGVSHGPSDSWGYKPLDRERPTEVDDIHATILRLFGIGHQRLTFRANGIDRRLTDVHGHLIPEIMA